MMPNRMNMLLACCLVAVVMITLATRVDYTRPNIEILPDMKYTPAWMAYRQNPNFPNGRTLQAPVAGTIARGQLPLHYEPSKQDAERAGAELENPYKSLESDQASLHQSIRRGEQAYRVFCVVCHGPTGMGDGPVAKRGFPPPPSLLNGNSVQMKDGQLFHILTYGQGSMSGFAAQISRSRRWDLINYLRSLQSVTDAVTDAEADAAADERADVLAAENVRLESTESGELQTENERE